MGDPATQSKDRLTKCWPGRQIETRRQGVLAWKRPGEQQGPQMAAFPGQMVPQHQVMAESGPPQQPQHAAPAPQGPPEHHFQQAPQAQPEGWYNGVQYQPPVEVATIGQIPAFGSAGVYDPWGPKVEFEDPSMQLPSARIENM